MKEVIIKPCPFCGNPAQLRGARLDERPDWYKKGDWHVIECSDEYCAIHPKMIAGTREELVSSWNIRRRANLLTYHEEEQKFTFS